MNLPEELQLRRSVVTGLGTAIAVAICLTLAGFEGALVGLAGLVSVAVAGSAFGAPFAKAATALDSGTEARRLGDYRLGERIGAGAMGEVYRAESLATGRPAALKLLPAGKSTALAIARFEREAQVLRSLSHPNAVSVLDTGRSDDGTPYIAMELLEGTDLETLVAEQGPQEPARVIAIAMQVAGALGAAHDRGLLHRDIKPANIVLCRGAGGIDVAKLVDFGLAKDTRSDVALTGQDLLGTPLYMAPETLVAPDRVDGRADIYALGAVLYLLLTGKPLFEGKSVLDVCIKQVHSAPIALSDRLDRDLPAGLEDLVLRCLAKRPEDRPASAHEIVARLARGRKRRFGRRSMPNTLVCGPQRRVNRRSSPRHRAQARRSCASFPMRAMRVTESGCWAVTRPSSVGNRQPWR